MVLVIRWHPRATRGPRGAFASWRRRVVAVMKRLTVVSRKDVSARRACVWKGIPAAVAGVTAACGNPASPDDGVPTSAPATANASAVSGAADESCTFVLSTTRQRFDRAGGEGSLMVQAPAGCSWTVAPDAPWVTITGGTNMA